MYFRQLLSGVDYAAGDPVASQMVNFAYLLGDVEKKQAVIVDPAYAVDDLLAVAERDGYEVVGALASHHHPDHVGGTFMGYSIEGVSALLGRKDVKVHAHEAEVSSITKITGASTSNVVGHASGDVISVGDVEVKLLHTPGHTPGSCCFLVGGMLVSGDTLFLDGCGRTDLPGSNPEEMYHSLQKLASLPDSTEVYPGHRYSPSPSGSLHDVKAANMVFKPATQEQWMQIFAGG